MEDRSCLANTITAIRGAQPNSYKELDYDRDLANPADVAMSEKDLEAFGIGHRNDASSMHSIQAIQDKDWKAITSIQRIFSWVSDESTNHNDLAPRPWKVSLWRLGPLSGLFCMLLALCSIFASLGILVGSRGMPIDDWTVTPATHLAICTAVANLGMRYACIQGIVIAIDRHYADCRAAWWTRALRGATIDQLHYDWRAGTSLRGAATAGRRTGLLALASIVSTIVVVDGPFLQRASTVELVPNIGQEIILGVQMAQEIPTDYTGYWNTAKEAGLGYFWEDAFNRSSIPTAVNGTGPNNIVGLAGLSSLKKTWANEWVFKDDTLPPNFVSGCPDICNVRIRAPALAATSCRSFQTPVNYTQPLGGAVFPELLAAAPLELDAFLIDISLQLHGNETIDVFTGYAENVEGIGVLNVTACNMASAIGEYEILINKNPPSVTASWVPHIIALANNTRVNYQIRTNTYRPSTLGGIVNEAYLKWASRLSYWTSRNGSPDGSVFGYFAEDLFTGTHGDYFHNFADPLQHVLRDLNKLMFITGVYAAMNETETFLASTLDQGLPVNINTTGTLLGKHDVVHTDLNWFAAAAIVEFACVFLVLPTYWNWWTLGRPVSFSLIELAKAFESPIFAVCNSNSSGRDIVRAIGDTRLQYGTTGHPHERTRLAFASPGRGRFPSRSSNFSD